MATNDSLKIERIAGRAVPLRGNDVDTDRIMPARFLRTVTFEGLEQHVFEDDREHQGASHPFSNPVYRGASVLIVNDGFGSGSSREHAPQGLYRWGIRAMVGESFSEIFFGNSLKLGLPCLTATAADVDYLMERAERQPDAEMQIAIDALEITAGDRALTLAMPASALGALLAGTWDATSLLLDNAADVEAIANRLPYVTGTW